MIGDTASRVEVGGLFLLGQRREFCVYLSIYTDVTFILVFRFSLKAENLDEKLH